MLVRDGSRVALAPFQSFFRSFGIQCIDQCCHEGCLRAHFRCARRPCFRGIPDSAFPLDPQEKQKQIAEANNGTIPKQSAGELRMQKGEPIS